MAEDILDRAYRQLTIGRVGKQWPTEEDLAVFHGLIQEVERLRTEQRTGESAE